MATEPEALREAQGVAEPDSVFQSLPADVSQDFDSDMASAVNALIASQSDLRLIDSYVELSPLWTELNFKIQVPTSVPGATYLITEVCTSLLSVEKNLKALTASIAQARESAAKPLPGLSVDELFDVGYCGSLEAVGTPKTFIGAKTK